MSQPKMKPFTDLGRMASRAVVATLALLVLLFGNQVAAQTTSGTVATGNTLFNSTFNCSGCHTANSAPRSNANNAGGHITYANTLGMGGTAGTATQYAHIAAYLNSLYTDLSAQAVSFQTSKAISIPNITLNSTYGDYVGLRQVAAPSRGVAIFSFGSTTVNYSPSAGQCGTDSFTYEAYRSVGNGSGTSNVRTVSLTIANPSVPNITGSASTASGTYNLAGFSYTPFSNGGPVNTYAITVGTLPMGLSLNTTTGVISGTPTQVVTNSNVTLTARNCSNGNLTGQTSNRIIAITISKASQTITFGAQTTPRTYVAGGTFAINPLATGGLSGNAVTYSSLTTGICTVASTTVTMVTGGTCTIAADQAGNTNYNAASQVTRSVTINPASQTITFNAQTTPRTFVAGGTFAINPLATGGLSGNAVTYSSLTASVCTVSSTTVTMVGAGTCTIAADQAGNTSYSAATQATQSVTINQASQTISFGAQVTPRTFVAGGTFAISPLATGGLSGNSIAYSSLTASVCTVSSTIVTMVGAGTCTIAANQAGNTNYAAASQVTQSVTINQASQTITFGAQTTPRIFVASGTFAISPTATGGLSGNAVTYSSLTASICTVSTTTVTMVAVGTCTIAANQAGNTNYAAATQTTQSVTINQASQSITFGAQVTPRTFVASGTFTISPTATGGLSGNAITYSSLTTGVCTVSSTTVTMVGAGTCTIAADQAGNANYTAATQATQIVTINLASQTISFGAQSTPRTFVASSTFAISPTATGGLSGNAVTYSSLTTGVCTVSSTTVTMVGAGTCTIAANQAGDTNYAAASQITQSVIINQASQAITFGAQSTPRTFIASGTFAINPTATGGLSGNAVTYSSLTASVCTVLSATVTMVGVGTCTIAANQAGNSDYAAATQATQSVTIDQAGQTITFGSQASPRTFAAGGTFAISPTATGGLSGNAVSYSSLTTSVCTVSSTTVTMVGAGACTIAADQAGNTNYAPANQATQSVTINKATQSISFPVQSPTTQAFSGGGTFSINPLATGGASGNAISYSSLTSGICTVAGTTVTIVAVGTCTIAANQAGSANYAPATQITQSVGIGLASQTITFATQVPATQSYTPAGSFTINPVAVGGASGNAVSYSSLTTGVCTVPVATATTVNIVSAGICTIAADQLGDATYANASQVTRNVTITEASQVITFPPQSTLSRPFVDSGTFAVSPTATGGGSGSAVVYSSLTPSVCTIAGTNVTIVAVGTCTIAADQAGDTNYLMATQVSQSVAIGLASQTITFGTQSPASQSYNAAGTFAVNPLATGGASGNSVTYSSLTPAICTVSGAAVTTVTVGTCTIAANQLGNAMYADASQVTQGITITQAVQVISFPPQTSLSRPFVASGTFAISPVAAGGISGNALSYSSLTAGVCSVSGTTVTIVGVGTCTIAADQLGDTNYAAATQVTQNVAIGLASQTITFATQSPAVQNYSAGGMFAINPTASGGASSNAVTYSSLTPGVCTVSGTSVTIATVGTCTIAADQLGNGSYADASQVTQNVTINQASQTLSFGVQVPATRTFGTVSSFSINPLASGGTSGNAVTYSSLDTAVCTVSGTTVTIVSVGTCNIAADQAGNTNYTAATQATESVTISPADQAITFTTQVPATHVFVAASTFAVNPVATGGASGNPVIYSSITTSVCTLSGTTVTMVAGGMCIIAADQVGDSTYSSAPQVTQSVAITQASQTINFGAQVPASQSFSIGGTFSINPLATGGASGNAIAYGSVTPGICTVSGTTVTIVAAGNCKITADQAGNASYSAATQIAQTVAIGLASQTITFGTQVPATRSYSPGGTFAINPLASGGASGNAVTYSSPTAAVCTVSGTTVTIVAVGTCTIAADQLGNSNYAAASQITQDVAINQASQVISFGAQTPATQAFSVGGFFTINPTATGGASGNAIVYSTLTASVCMVNGTTVSIVTSGTCTIAANQTGNTDYSAASQVSRNVAITAIVAGAPTIGTGTAGNGQATINFTAPASDGGSPITSYTATCNPGAVSASNASLSIVVTGLTNEAAYSCSVTATNSAGTGSPSATVSVKPTASTGPGNWNTICTACHTPLPSGLQLNGAGTTGTVISNVRSIQPLMLATPAVQNLTAAELADLAAYIADQLPAISAVVPANTPTPIDVSSHITFTLYSFESVESVIQPLNGTLSAFNGTTVTYTPNPGYVGADSFTYRGKNTTRSFVGDERTINITVSASALLFTVNRAGTGSGTVTGSGINCGSNCVTAVTAGTMISLTATANTISTFTSWTGCTTSTGNQCSVTVNAAGSVTANFTALIFAPDEPTIGTATPGNGQIAVSFTAPAFDGGAPITSYKVTCQPGTVSATGAASPITVTGLTNGVSYSCSATATNSSGEGLPSATVSATPLLSLQALTLSAVVSRKTHFGVGDFDIVLDQTVAIGGAVTTEPRVIGSGHRIVFQFTTPVTLAGSATAVDSSAAAVGSATAAVNPLASNEVIVTLTGVAENQRVSVSLAGVNGSNAASVSVGFLIGDINNTRSVNASDISGIKARSGQITDATNFKYDLNISGAITAADISVVKARSGLLLAP